MLAPSQSAPTNRHPFSLDHLIVAVRRVASVKLEPSQSARQKSASVRSAPWKLAALHDVETASASSPKLLPRRIDPLRSAPSKSEPVKSSPERFAPVRF